MVQISIFCGTNIRIYKLWKAKIIQHFVLLKFFTLSGWTVFQSLFPYVRINTMCDTHCVCSSIMDHIIISIILSNTEQDSGQLYKTKKMKNIRKNHQLITCLTSWFRTTTRASVKSLSTVLNRSDFAENNLWMDIKISNMAFFISVKFWE